MKAKITRLKPRPASYEEALDAWKRGAISLCADLLQASRAPNAIFLRVRCLLRLGRADEALSHLFDLDLEDLVPEHAAQLLVMRSTALYITKRRNEAVAQAKIALNCCRAIGNTAMHAELLYYKAVSSILHGCAEEVEDVVAEIDAIKDDPSSLYDIRSYPFSLWYWRARVYEASSLALICGDERRRVSRASMAIQMLEESGVRDDFVHVCMLGSYADSLRVSGSEEFVRFSVAKIEKFENNCDVAPFLSAAFFNLAECASNEGELQEALRLLRRATDLAPGGALQLRALIARVDLLHESGETLGSRDLLEQALAFSQTIDWNISPNLGRTRQLLDLASRVASFSPDDAAILLETFYSFDHCTDRAGGIHFDPGADAEEQVALAQIALSRGEVDIALERLFAGLAMYKKIGYKAKIASISFEIGRLTHEESALTTVRLWAMNHPRSLLARKMNEFDRQNARVEQSQAQAAR